MFSRAHMSAMLLIWQGMTVACPQLQEQHLECSSDRHFFKVIQDDEFGVPQ